ncbi:MAG: hypothetical protein U9N84_02120, partial [Actinomycetota bacterium]|nr:hypothetical protein [Actinomycetota bacterium]
IWYLLQPCGLRLVDRLADHSDHFWILALVGVPLAVLGATLQGEQGLAGWNRFSYAVLILYGYLLASDRRFGRPCAGIGGVR